MKENQPTSFENIIAIAEFIYKHAKVVSFSEKNWNENTFRKEWFDGCKLRHPNAPGIYWILSDSKIEDAQTPGKFPAKGCKFAETYNNNRILFTDLLLTSPDETGLRVIYNGHESNLMNRVRQHFVLSEENNKTGALGIRHYTDFSKNKWILRYFTTNEIEELSSKLNEDEQKVILSLLKSKTGRNALESAWRAQFGWPILCKQ